MRLTVLQDLVEFGLAYDGVNDVRGAQRDVQIRKIVLMQQRGVQGRNHHDVDVREIVLQQQAVMRLFADRDRPWRRRGTLLRKIVDGSLRLQRGAQHAAEHYGTQQTNGWVHGAGIVRCQKSPDTLNSGTRWSVAGDL